MSVTQAYGANIAFIEELYERYRANPESVRHLTYTGG